MLTRDDVCVGGLQDCAAVADAAHSEHNHDKGRHAEYEGQNEEGSSSVGLGHPVQRGVPAVKLVVEVCLESTVGGKGEQ